jgi:hypothetical protein
MTAPTEPIAPEKKTRGRPRGVRNKPKVNLVPDAEQPYGGKPQDLEQLTAYGAWLVGAIVSGRLDPRVGREAAAALNVLKGVLAAKDLTAHKVEQLKKKLLKEMQNAERDR